METSTQVLLAIGLPVGLLLMLMVIAFQVMALEAYREYKRLGGNKNGLSWREYQFAYTLYLVPSDDPRQEVQREKFNRYRRISTWLGVGFFGLFGIVFLMLK